MRTLYPPIQPFATHEIAVDQTHTLYVEQCGQPKGLPVIFLHGGPGAGCESMHRRFFDPEKYHVILFDQRGCGKSQPHAELANNTTAHLIDDIETLREHFNLSRWVVFGGSWGSTLGLAYAQAHPQRVLGLVLRGIFLGRPRDIKWFYQEGAGRLFPDLWEQFLEPIPEHERHDLLYAYYRRLTGGDELERLRVAKAWAAWEGATLSLERKINVIEHFTEAHMALSLARIEAHYFVNDCFLQTDQLLREAQTIADIPGYIVQGRYDVITPVEGAWILHRAWPRAELRIVSPAGHAAGEPAIVDALVTATDALTTQLT